MTGARRRGRQHGLSPQYAREGRAVGGPLSPQIRYKLKCAAALACAMLMRLRQWPKNAKLIKLDRPVEVVPRSLNS
jgi:hypothetical protein